MKNVLFLLAFIVIPVMAFSQTQETSTRTREIGFRFEGVSDFNLIYKKEKKENVYQRWRSGIASLSFDHGETFDRFNIGLFIAFGREKRKMIMDDLFFIHGWEPFLGLNFQQQFTDVRNSFSLQINPGIGYILGLSYNISPRIALGLEIIPSLHTALRFDDNGFQDSFAINAEFNSNNVSAVAVYRL